MRKGVRRQRAEAEPAKLLAHGVLVRTFDAGKQRERPLAVPVLARLAVDAMRGLLEARRAERGQSVVTASPQLLHIEPAVFRQAEHRGAHEPLTGTKIGEALNQAADPHAAAARRDRIAEHRRNK